VASNSQSITRLDCHAAVCLPDDVQKCLGILEVIDEVWIGPEQNTVDAIVDE